MDRHDLEPANGAADSPDTAGLARAARTVMSSPVDRRRLLLGAGIGGGGVALGLLGAAPASADERRHSVQGAWVVKVKTAGESGTTLNVTTFGGGGVVASVDLVPPGPTALGAWSSTGGDGFKATFWQAAFDDKGKPVGTVRIRVRGRVHDSTASGTFTGTVFNTKGTMVGSEHGTFTATRIEA